MDESNLVKVVFRQEYEGDDEVDVECPWAEALGGNKYRLKNFPFYTYGISFDDVFEAEPAYDDERPYLTKVIEKSGHKTLRLQLPQSIQESPECRQILDDLNAMDCGYEGNGHRFFVINVQPHCDFDAVVGFINGCDLDWEYADPTY